MTTSNTGITPSMSIKEARSMVESDSIINATMCYNCASDGASQRSDVLAIAASATSAVLLFVGLVTGILILVFIRRKRFAMCDHYNILCYIHNYIPEKGTKTYQYIYSYMLTAVIYMLYDIIAIVAFTDMPEKIKHLGTAVVQMKMGKCLKISAMSLPLLAIQLQHHKLQKHFTLTPAKIHPQIPVHRSLYRRYLCFP